MLEVGVLSSPGCDFPLEMVVLLWLPEVDVPGLESIVTDKKVGYVDSKYCL